MNKLRENYPLVPILGLTATATIEVRKDLAEKLKLQKDFHIFQGSFNRPNHMLNIVRLPANL